MQNLHKDDIRVGPDKWIEFVSVEDKRENAVNIDSFIEPMQQFWKRLETECVAGCCGIDAFGLFPENIGRATGGSDTPSLNNRIDILKDFVQQNASDVFVSEFLNQYFHRTVLLKLLDHIVEHIHSDDWPLTTSH